MRRALALSLALFAAACTHAKTEVAPATPAPAIISVPRPLPGATVPYDVDIAEALFAVLAECEAASGADCAAVPTSIRIDGSRCIAIAAEDGNPSAACRVDWVEAMRRPRPDVPRRDQCVRFILLNVEGGSAAKVWAVRYTPPGHNCEVPPK